MRVSMKKPSWTLPDVIRHADPKLKMFGQESLVAWKFEQIKLPYVPTLLQCRIDAFGESSIGMSTAFGHLERSAYQVAFAEAFERLISCLHAKHSRTPLTSSNGIAAGVNVRHAIESAKAELIERHFVLKAWQTQTGWSPYTPSFLNNLRLWIMKSRGWEFKWFQIKSKSRSDTVLACLGLHESYGASFDAALLRTEHSRKDAELKVAESVMFFCADSMNQSTDDNYMMPDLCGPEGHKTFYRLPKNLAAFEFLTCKSSRVPFIDHGSKGEVIQTQVLYDQPFYPVVARAHSTKLANICWGKSSIRGENKWPHPIV